MKRDPVQSTTTRSVGYEAKSKVLEIEFESGVVYQLNYAQDLMQP